MNPFERFNPTRPSQVLFTSLDKGEVERIGQVLLLTGYHPHFNFSPTFQGEFEAGHVFQVFVPVEEMRAGREVIARWENHGPEL